MKKNLLLLLVSILIVYSCGNSPKSNSPGDYSSGGYSPTGVIDDGRNDGGGYNEGNPDDTPDIGSVRLTGRIETCNKCMGYGMVQDGLYGQPEICKFCWISTNMRMQQGWTGFDGRYGQVDAVFNTLPADYFDELNWNTGDNEEPGSEGGMTPDQIEESIEKHEENIAKMEEMLEYIEGAITRTQLQQQIIEEQYEIKRLKRMLNN